MNKTDLIAELASANNITKVQASAFLDSLLDIWKNALKRKEEVKMLGFGSFFVKFSKSRMVNNPRTGEAMEIPSMHRVKFAPGKALQDVINE
ncbi:HU family DNA-binding protein [Candidatus Fokinia crypta]|uniref:DNA-binding protein HU n=1 Tax=Candidatus Fokinia crypta TaxID=1920990 RepID=A0ABZ0UP11_9RICK|nr:HU family DNA-binding protein [Candidatus Fokinia cryptica]WPX97854.1 DNA-binding protein HU [Candidatus Fokinia cryptica]